MLGLALFAFQTIQQGREFLDLAPQRQNFHFLRRDGPFQIFDLPKHFPEFPLHRERPFGTLLAASHCYVVEAFAGLRQEKRVRIFESQAARDPRFRHDIPVTQLGQDHFQRFPKAIQHADRVLQRKNLRRGRRAMRRFIQHE